MTEAEVRAYESGNYDGAYVSEDLDVALAKRQADVSKTQPRTKVTLAAYVAGFYGTYELHEIASEEDREAVAAWREAHPEYA